MGFSAPVLVAAEACVWGIHTQIPVGVLMEVLGGGGGARGGLRRGPPVVQPVEVPAAAVDSVVVPAAAAAAVAAAAAMAAEGTAPTSIDDALELVRTEAVLCTLLSQDARWER